MKLASATRFRLRGGRVARNIAWLCALWIVFGSVGLTMLGVSYESVGWLAMYALMGLIVATIVAVTRRGGTLGVLRSPGLEPVDVDESQIVAGIREELDGNQQVTFELADGRGVAVRVADAEAAERLLDAARVGLRQRALSLRVGKLPTAALRFVLVLLVFVSTVAVVPWAVSAIFARNSGATLICALFAAGCAVAWVHAIHVLRTQAVTIGRDGVRLARTFLGFATMEVEVRDCNVVVYANGRRRTVVAGHHEEALVIAKRILASQLAYHERRARQVELLARGGREPRRWREEVARLLDVQDYRAPMERDELTALLEDPAAPIEQRLGAALAISSLPADAPERLRIAAAIDTTADPKLRVLLERAAEGDVDLAAVESARRL